MIAYLNGKIKYIGPGWIILDVNNIGYKVNITNVRPKTEDGRPKTENTKRDSNFLSSVFSLKSSVELYIHHHIREDRSDLYGFETINELNMFELLLEVPGVGPKMGMNILNKSNIDDVKNAIIKGNTAFFKAISGVGSKLASKILLELKNKLGADDYDIIGDSELSTELMDVMESLGYKKAEIYPHLSKIPEDINSQEEKIKWLLRRIKK